MNFFKPLSGIIAISALITGSVTSGCGPGSVDKADYIHAIVHVKDNAGFALAGLNVTDYNATISFVDGGQIVDGFKLDTFSDANGDVDFTTAELGLGLSSDSTSCTEVCVDYDGFYCYASYYDCTDSSYVTLYDVNNISDVSPEIGYVYGGHKYHVAGAAVTAGVQVNTGGTTYLEEDDFYTNVTGVFAASAGNTAMSARVSVKPERIVYKGADVTNFTPAQIEKIRLARRHILDSRTHLPLAASAFKTQL